MEVYVDDMIVKSKAEGDHSRDLQKTFDILRAFNIKLNPKKCIFGVRSGKFLDFMISSRGIEANPNKIQGCPRYEATLEYTRGATPNRLYSCPCIVYVPIRG